MLYWNDCSIRRARSESWASARRGSAWAIAACRARARRRPPADRRGGGVGGGLPLAHEVADALAVAGLVGLVEPLHERLGVRAARLVLHEVGVHALGGVAEQRLEVVGRRRAGGGGDRTHRRRRLAEALLGRLGRDLVVEHARAGGDDREDLGLQLVHLEIDDADQAQVVRLEGGELRAQRRVLRLDLREPVAERSGAAADKVDQPSEDALAVDAHPVVVVLAGHPAVQVGRARHGLLGERALDIEVLGVDRGRRRDRFAPSTSGSYSRGQSTAASSCATARAGASAP